MSVLEIKDLHVEIEGKEILKGVNLTLRTGEIAAIMGPNGTGKSTLSAAIMGNPNYEVTKGEILFDGVNILELEVDERARMGLFLMRLTLVWISMPLKWFPKGSMKCLAKILVP